MRTKEDIQRMELEDTATGLTAHYKPLAQFINERNYKTGIEIGTAYGGLANHLMENCKLDLLITIDPYKYYPPMPGLFDQEDYDMVREQTTKRLSAFPQCQMAEENSRSYYNREVAIKIAHIAMGSKYDFPQYDFVFIDGLHEYETIKWECEHYQNLLKEGGALMGHDYNLFEDVKRAVDEFGGDRVKQLDGDIWYINY